METKITTSKPRIKKIIVQNTFKKTRLLIFIFSLLILEGCLNDDVGVDTSKPVAVPFQLHNFNAPLTGGALEGTAPDIYYFKQKEDGSYVFMLTYYTHAKNFGWNWLTDYVLVEADANGVIQKTTAMKLPSKGYSTPPLEQVWDAPPNYVADKNGFLYYQQQTDCLCGNMFFNLNPETGLFSYFSASVHTEPLKFSRTSDGGVITVGGLWAPDFEKHSASGKLEFREPLNYWETSPSLDYLMDKNGDYYFIALYHGTSVYQNDPQIWWNWFTENTAKSFFGFKIMFKETNPPLIDWEIRFGPGIKQKAHRFKSDWEGVDYVDVPFQVWDLTNNRQLMAGFRDQDEDKKFTLRPIKFNVPLIFFYGVPFSNPASWDPTFSTEWIFAYPTIPYSTTPNQNIFGSAAAQPTFITWPYLAEGATWNPDDLPTSSFAIKTKPKPNAQLIKVNASGSSVVKENYVLGTVPYQKVFKIVPHDGGFAVLINAPNSVNEYQTTQLILLDANFNQSNVLAVKSSEGDNAYQIEGNSNNDRVFYSRITPNSGEERTNKSTLLLSVVHNNSLLEKSLDHLIPFRIEKYRITPTKTGGVSIVAWVRPTKDTRDLLFFELDENLELVKR